MSLFKTSSFKIAINNIKNNSSKINTSIKPIFKALSFKIFYIKLALNRVNYNSKTNINIKIVISSLSLKKALVIIALKST